jgi:hypothetical protein
MLWKNAYRRTTTATVGLPGATGWAGAARGPPRESLGPYQQLQAASQRGPRSWASRLPLNSDKTSPPSTRVPRGRGYPCVGPAARVYRHLIVSPLAR